MYFRIREASQQHACGQNARAVSLTRRVFSSVAPAPTATPRVGSPTYIAMTAECRFWNESMYLGFTAGNFQSLDPRGRVFQPTRSGYFNPPSDTCPRAGLYRNA